MSIFLQRLQTTDLIMNQQKKLGPGRLEYLDQKSNPSQSQGQDTGLRQP